MNISLQFHKGLFELTIMKHHRILLSLKDKGLDELLNNEVVEELLKGASCYLEVGNLLVLKMVDEYPVISKSEMIKFHQEKINQLLRYESKAFKIAISKKYQLAKICSYHLKEDVLKLVNHFQLIVRSISIMGAPKAKEDLLYISEIDCALWIKGERIYTSELDFNVAIITKNLLKAFDNECFYGKIHYQVTKTCEKALTIFQHLKQKGDYEWIED